MNRASRKLVVETCASRRSSNLDHFRPSYAVNPHARHSCCRDSANHGGEAISVKGGVISGGEEGGGLC